MTIKVAINGYGRIGSKLLRAHHEGGKRHTIQIVAIDLGNCETNAHLTARSASPANAMFFNDDRIRILAQRRPDELPWRALGGAKRVIVFSPGGDDADASIMFGVNHKTLKAGDTVISEGKTLLSFEILLKRTAGWTAHHE